MDNKDIATLLASAIVKKHTKKGPFWPGTELLKCIHCGSSKIDDPFEDDIVHLDHCIVPKAEKYLEENK